jgi:hypothetical protein
LELVSSLIISLWIISWHFDCSLIVSWSGEWLDHTKLLIILWLGMDLYHQNRPITTYLVRRRHLQASLPVVELLRPLHV